MIHCKNHTCQLNLYPVDSTYFNPPLARFLSSFLRFLCHFRFFSSPTLAYEYFDLLGTHVIIPFADGPIASPHLVETNFLGRPALLLIAFFVIRPRMWPPAAGYGHGRLLYVSWDSGNTFYRFQLSPQYLDDPTGFVDYCVASLDSSIYLVGLSTDAFNMTAPEYPQSPNLKDGINIYRLALPGQCDVPTHNPYAEVQVDVRGSYRYNRTFDRSYRTEVIEGGPTNSVLNGTSITIQCREGLNSSGPLHTRCIENDNWAAFIFDVEHLPSTSEDYYGATIVSRNDRLRLGYSWSVNPDLFTCAPAQCEPLIRPYQTDFLIVEEPFGRWKYQTRVLVSCSRSYRLVGASEVVCQSDGQWSSSPGTCEYTAATQEAKDACNTSFPIALPFAHNHTYTCFPTFDSMAIHPVDDGFEPVHVTNMTAYPSTNLTEAYGFKYLRNHTRRVVFGLNMYYHAARDPSDDLRCTEDLSTFASSVDVRLSSRDGTFSIPVSEAGSRADWIYRVQPGSNRILPIFKLPNAVGDYWFVNIIFCHNFYDDVPFPDQVSPMSVVAVTSEISRDCGGPPREFKEFFRRACYLIYTNNILQLGKPSFVPGTLRLQGSEAQGYINVPTPSSYQIAMDIEGGVFDGMVDVMKITYGPKGNLTAYSCQPYILASGTTVYCYTQSGANGTYLNIQAKIEMGVDSEVLTTTDFINYPAPPSVHSVVGCSPVQLPDGRLASLSCPTSATYDVHGERLPVNLTIRGTNIVPPIRVLVGGVLCDSGDYVNHEDVIECRLPPGTGSAVALSVISNNVWAEGTAGLLNYARPVIRAIHGCAVTQTPTWIMDCSRKGGDVIIIEGDDFGDSGAAVMIGSNFCANVTHLGTGVSRHQSVQCIVPPGFGLGNTVMLLQQSGQLSIGSFAILSYEGCPRGSYWNRSVSDCLECPPGRFQNEKGMDICHLCRSGTWTNQTGAKRCQECEPGKYKAEVGPGECIDCQRSMYSPGTGSTACRLCQPGYVSNAQATDCEACPIGKYGRRRYIPDTTSLTTQGRYTSDLEGNYSLVETSLGFGAGGYDDTCVSCQVSRLCLLIVKHASSKYRR